MDIDIKWDPDLEAKVGELVRPAMKELAAKRTRQYGELVEAYKDGDLETVKAELKRIYGADGGTITDPELSQHAEAIIEGQRIEFRAQ